MILLIENDVTDFFKILTSWSNPFFLSIFVLITLIILIYFINKYLIRPMEQKHILEKKEIELKTSRMMALFAELDPDPVIRVDTEGKAIFYNSSAMELLKLDENTNFIEKYFKLSETDLLKKIQTDSSVTVPFLHNETYYNVLIKGNSNLGIAQLYFRDISETKLLEKKLRKLSQYLQNLIEEERSRMATELHDGIVQELYFIQLSLRKIMDENPVTQPDNFEFLKKQLEKITEELRRIIYDLKPKILDEMGLDAALKTLCNTTVRESGIKGSVQVLGLDKRLDKKYEIFFYRFVQEALSNIIKHSGASEFSVTLFRDDSSYRVVISDNGEGINENNYADDTLTGFGLFNMKERTENLGGLLKIDSSEESGVTLIAEIPVEIK
ncbi:MAG: sensor histidine kinase [Ignavibacteriales bacterium]|nr:MAG: sensor histidine kinase [Ignavibacteriales bacterium]